MMIVLSAPGFTIESGIGAIFRRGDWEESGVEPFQADIVSSTITLPHDLNSGEYELVLAAVGARRLSDGLLCTGPALCARILRIGSPDAEIQNCELNITLDPFWITVTNERGELLRHFDVEFWCDAWSGNLKTDAHGRILVFDSPANRIGTPPGVFLGIEAAI
jgi:hypothetical protein